MYKRYLEPDDDSPLTKYMAKKISGGRTQPNFKMQRRRSIITSNSEEVPNIDIPNEAGFGNEEIKDAGLIDVDNIEQVEISDDEAFNFFRTISDQLIHPSLECKTADAITMILAYFLQHHLTWVALEDLLKLLHNILGDDSNLPKTKYLFKKCFGPNQRTIIHFYCKKCLVYIDTYENLESFQNNRNKTDRSPDFCSVCQTEYSLMKMNDGHFFMELPLREQIEERIGRDTGILDYNPKSDTGCIADIFDGDLYKSLRAKVGTVPLVTLTMNTDGVRVFKSKRKASLWPIQWIINEVPPHKRYKRENVLLSGIWFGSDPCFEIYFKPLVKEMNDLDERKIVVSTSSSVKTVTVRVLHFSADLPAKSKVQRFKQFNGEFGCSYCHHPGFLVGSSKSSKYTESDGVEHTLRTHAGTLSLINLLISTGQANLGVKGISPLLGFKDFDLIRGTVIDYMHCVLEGVTSSLLDLWFDSNNHREKYYITPQNSEKVNKMLRAIKPLKAFSIKPRSIEEKEYWKAHEFKDWLLYYAVPSLTGILKSVYLNHLTLLSEAIFIFLQSKITRVEFEKASKNLVSFVTEFQKLYGEENMTNNVHLLKHLPKCVTDCGPLWAYSNFCFENNNGSLVKHVHGTTDVLHQIASKYEFNNSLNRLKIMCESNSSTFNYIEKMKTMRVKKSEKIGHITLFGSPHKHRLSEMEKPFFLKENLEHTEAYYKFFYGNDVFLSTSYKKAKQTDDTTVMLKDKRVGKISLIFKEEESVFLLLQMLDTERVPHFPSHIEKVSMKDEYSFEKIPAEDIQQKLLLISTLKESFITKIPNHYECD